MNGFRTRRQMIRSAAAVLGACAAACDDEEKSRAPRMPKVKWRVVGTTHWVTAMAAQVGGEAVEAVCLMKEGANPHQFKPAAPDVAKLRTADLVVRHGLGLDDAWPVDYGSLESHNVRLCTATERVPADRLIRAEGGGGPPDPHVWMDAELAAFMVEAVEAALTVAMPRLTEYFQARAQRMRVDLGEAHRFVGALMKELPEKDRFLFTTHPSMAYFARAYGLETRSLATADGQVPAALPEDLTDWLSRHAAGTLFREQDTDEAVLRTLLRGHRIDPAPLIYSLATAPAGTRHGIASRQYEVSGVVDALRYTGDIIQSRLQVD